MLNNKILIENINKLCNKHNIKITNLEKKLGFGAGIINRWGNDADPSLSKIIQIADYFKVSIDEVVGYNNVINDEFLEKIISQTEDKIIQWKSYNENTENQPKQHYGFLDLSVNDFNSIEEFDNYISFHKEISYYTQINNGYISLYGQYNGFNIFKPEELELFIQPTIESDLIPQKNYSTKQLTQLWLKVLYSMETNAPDEIKAEEFKNTFILNKSVTNDDDVISGGLNNAIDVEAIEKCANNPAVQQFIELYSKPEFQKMQQIMTSPNFQKAVETANRMQKYLNLYKK